MGSCAAPSAKGDDKFITTDYLQQCPANCDETAAQLAVLRQFVERRREALANLEVQLAAMPTAPAQHAESLP
jgi:hypothetical protein